MVDEMMTDEERGEALKRWLRENGAVLVTGVVLGLGGLFGFQGWQSYREDKLLQAALVYEQVEDALAASDQGQVQALAAALREDHAANPYATQASFALARLQVEAGDLAAAAQTLEEAIAKESDVAIAEVGRNRLGRVMLADGRAEEVLTLLDGNPPSNTFRAMHFELYGDALYELGRKEAARTAYNDALNASDGRASGALQLKLTALGPAPTMADDDEATAPDAES